MNHALGHVGSGFLITTPLADWPLNSPFTFDSLFNPLPSCSLHLLWGCPRCSALQRLFSTHVLAAPAIRHGPLPRLPDKALLSCPPPSLASQWAPLPCPSLQCWSSWELCPGLVSIHGPQGKPSPSFFFSIVYERKHVSTHEREREKGTLWIVFSSCNPRPSPPACQDPGRACTRHVLMPPWDPSPLLPCGAPRCSSSHHACTTEAGLLFSSVNLVSS